jgi:hypothetical protein
MLRRHPGVRIGAPIAIGLACSIFVAGAVLAHPATEGDHPAGCIATVEPGTVPVGGQFTVSGNFTGASIFLVRGAGAAPAEDAQPDATTPQSGSGFSVTFTAEPGDEGEWTVVAAIEASECGDTDGLVVTAAAPNTAMPEQSAAVTIGWAVLVTGLILGAIRLRRSVPD